MARRKTKISKPRRKTYAIVVEGKTEAWYFQMLKRNEPDLQINIKPEIPQKRKLFDQFKRVCELASDFTKVFWVIDLDTIITESKVVKKGKKTSIEKLKYYMNKLNNKHANVIVIINNPCLEFWFILHYKQTDKYFAKCSDVEIQLKRQLKGYKKTRRYFTKNNDDIYLKLKSNLYTALQNAQYTQRKNLDNVERGICEMNLIFETRTIKKVIEQN